MEQILRQVIRFTGPFTKKELGHSYLLLRDEGNILVACHSGPESPEELDEVEKLGGISSQWVCHQHDVNRNGLHERLHDRFGCSLHHHERDRSGVSKRTTCPVDPFGDDGANVGSDFEAHYYPACMDGHSIYRWNMGGKYLLITAHSFYLRDGEWNLFVPEGPRLRRELMRPQLPKIAKLKVDFVMPGYSAVSDEGETFYKLNRETRAKLKARLQEIMEIY